MTLMDSYLTYYNFEKKIKKIQYRLSAKPGDLMSMNRI